MPTVPMTMLTIVADHGLEARLAHELYAHGVTGFTITDARGERDRFAPPGSEGSNIRIDVIAMDDLVESFLDHLAKEYFERHPVIAWTSTVGVVRAEKFRASMVRQASA